MNDDYVGNKWNILNITWNWYKYRRWSNKEHGNLREWMKYHNIKIPYWLVSLWVHLTAKFYIPYSNGG